MSKIGTDCAVTKQNANTRRAMMIVKSIQMQEWKGSAFLDPEAIEDYDRSVARPTFGGKLDIDWVMKQG